MLAAAAKGLLELKRWLALGVVKDCAVGERFVGRFGVRWSGSEANAGAGGARSMRSSGKSGSEVVSMGKDFVEELEVTSNIELPQGR